MSIPITASFNTINPFSRPGIKLDPVCGVVFHYTGSNGEPDADNIDNYFESLKNQDENDEKGDVYASAHLQLDRDELIQSIPFDEVAYHCGGNYRSGITEKLGTWPNKATWGVEICEDINDQFPEDTFINAVELGVWFIVESRPGGSLSHLVKSGGLSVDDFYRHYDITGKICPKPWVEDESEWQRFLQVVRDRLNELEDETNMPMKLEDWQWDMLYKVMGPAYNAEQLGWDWMQKIVDKTLTASELAFLNTVLDGRIDRNIEV